MSTHSTDEQKKLVAEISEEMDHRVTASVILTGEETVSKSRVGHISQDSREPWSKEDIAELLTLVQNKVPIREIRQRLGRSGAAIQGRLNKIRREAVDHSPQLSGAV
jgi:hypothetical protein